MEDIRRCELCNRPLCSMHSESKCFSCQEKTQTKKTDDNEIKKQTEYEREVLNKLPFQFSKNTCFGNVGNDRYFLYSRALEEGW